MDHNTSLIEHLRGRVAGTKVLRDALSAMQAGTVEIATSSLEVRALLLASIAGTLGRRLAVIVPGDALLDDMELGLRLFHAAPAAVTCYRVPSLSPYQEVPPSLAVVRDEVRTLGLLAAGSVEIIILPARALFRQLPTIEDFRSRLVRLEGGMELDLHHLLQSLVENGYVRTDLVGEVGEFAFRGGILDLFPPDASRPLRIELFGDTIESIRTFEPESQRSDETLTSVVVEPVSQFTIDARVRSALARRLSLDFNDPVFKRDLARKIDQLNEHGGFPGVESYLPVATVTETFMDYFAGEQWMTVVHEPDEVIGTIDKYASLLHTEYENATADGKAVYAPDRILAPVSRIRELVEHARLSLTALQLTGSTATQFRFPSGDAKHLVNRLGDFPAEIEDARRRGLSTVIFVSTKGGREKTERLLKEFSIPFVESPEAPGEDVALTPGDLPRGFELEPIGLSVLSEWDLYERPSGGRVAPRKRASETFLADLRDLKPGDYIVHVDHGIGRFHGLRRIPFGDQDREVMELEYGESGKLLLPMENLNLIQKYSGGEDMRPKLDRLGGTSWARTKASVRKAMRDMADELLKLYATRQMIEGHAFSRDSPWQLEFEESFEFEETEDQATAIEEVKSDMESRRPMDRLLCGDVGYGKTEVAMRAAFKSVMDGKQVAVLAPTTILAYQHYRTLLRRFASFPVAIELLSRFRSAKEQKEIAKKIETGEIDILIGTHRILSRGLAFRDLGLLVIDEEQRFGVAQKERLKQFKKTIDVLAMSATPIPRTLHMSLAGIRDISIIETPPKDRLAIQTAVVPFHDDFVREALEFEIGRGGQAFFVHNRIESIYTMKEYLERLVPGIRVVVGHGRMDEQELERSMMAFIAREYDVLLATTIIENGIDIPACNTILINHAERFGLSQLYQLRGRVGRSDRLAFCYLLIPSDRVLTGDARKRLSAIQEFSDLGAGFRIAAKDLEIRGAGNILGGEQSGQIAAVGFEMYTKLLEETIREMRGEKIEEEVETTLNLGVDIYIPHEYIGDESLRMMFYKRIASARDEVRLEEIRNELRDRFGALPMAVENLLALIRLRHSARTIGVTSMMREASRVVIRFQPGARIDANRLLQLLADQPEARFSPSGALSLPLGARDGALIEALESLLSDIAAAA